MMSAQALPTLSSNRDCNASDGVDAGQARDELNNLKNSPWAPSEVRNFIFELRPMMLMIWAWCHR